MWDNISGIHFQFSLLLPTYILWSVLLSTSANEMRSKNDILYLKKLLLFRMQESSSGTPIPETTTLMTSVTPAELFDAVTVTSGTSLADEFYNMIYTGNGTVETDLRYAIKKAVPNLRALRENTTDRLTRQKALVELAVQMQPFIRPILNSHPNLTARVSALGEGMNRTGRDGGYGGGGYGGGGGGWGWGGWGWGGGGGGGGGHCCWGGGGWGHAVLVKGWGGDDDGLLKYLLAKGTGNDELSTLLPLLFGLIALLIMKLPT